MEKYSKKYYIYALVAVILWGTISPVNKILLNNLPEFEMLFVTSAVATVFLILLNSFTGRVKYLRDYKPSDVLIICSLGFLGTFIYNLCYNAGIARMSAQEACIINYLWPIMIMLFSCPILHETMNFKKIMAVVISFAGIVIIVTKLNFANFRLDSPFGVFCCLMAAVSYGLFSVLNKLKSYDQFVSMMLFYGVTALCSGILTLWSGDIAPISGMVEITGILWIGIVANAVAYLLWCMGLLGGDTARISNIAYITPFLSIVFSFLLLGEAISPYSILGLLFIIGGIGIQMKA